MSTPAPSIGGVSIAWLDQVAQALHRQGLTIQAGADGPWIEVLNTSTGRFECLTLESRPAGNCAFASINDRDEVLASLERRVARLNRP